MTIAALRRFAVARTLFPPTDLQRAIDTFGFVQADPIRAPARAQDLTLRHRVSGYTAGDLEQRYTELAVEESFFVNYGFITPKLHALMHPRGDIARWPKRRRSRAEDILAYVRDKGAVHPRQVDEHFAHGRVTNYWGGSSSASTHMLEQMHYLGLLRVSRRELGIRIYAVSEAGACDGLPESPDARIDALIDTALSVYAPMPHRTLHALVYRLRYAVPQWRVRLKAALARAKQRLAHARIDDVDWYWPANESTDSVPVEDRVRLLAPFDPIVWDRQRFELFWEWSYRFEAYTPVAKRTLGYYALPLLWRDRAVGWANVAVEQQGMRVDLGYVSGKAPRDRQFKRALDEELERLRAFLRLNDPPSARGAPDQRPSRNLKSAR